MELTGPAEGRRSAGSHSHKKTSGGHEINRDGNFNSRPEIRIKQAQLIGNKDQQKAKKKR